MHKKRPLRPPKGNYAKFLRSRYWKLVRSLVLIRDAFRCRQCGYRGVLLEVHHKSYDHHRDELNHLEDLVTVCNKCHEHIHNNPSKKTKPKTLLETQSNPQSSAPKPQKKSDVELRKETPIILLE